MQTADVIERLGVTRQTLARWIQNKKFPAPRRIGGRKFWDARWVENFLETGRCEQAVSGVCDYGDQSMIIQLLRDLLAGGEYISDAALLGKTIQFVEAASRIRNLTNSNRTSASDDSGADNFS